MIIKWVDKMVTTKIYKGFQIIIPSKIRKELDMKESDILEWEKQDDKAVITFRPKRELNDMIGLISDGDLDSVRDTKRAGMGEKYYD